MDTIFFLIAAGAAALLSVYFLRESAQHCFSDRYAHGNWDIENSGRKNMLLTLSLPLVLVAASALVHLVWKGCLGFFGWEIYAAAILAVVMGFLFFLQKQKPDFRKAEQDSLLPGLKLKLKAQKRSWIISHILFFISAACITIFLWLSFGDLFWGRLGTVAFVVAAVLDFFFRVKY